MVSKTVWAEGVSQIRRFLQRRGAVSAPEEGRGNPAPTIKSKGDFTYFEILTLLAMLLFRQAGVRIGIFEVGMGGRLDATNVLAPRLVILTPIHLDHEAFLGDTISEIAREKAAIIRKGADVVSAPQIREALTVIENQCRRKKARLWRARPLRGIPLGLRGDFQAVNAGAAIQAAAILRGRCGFPVSGRALRQGLRKKNWPGRMEFITGPRFDFLLDGAHNPAAIRALARNLKALYPRRKRILIFGAARDKKTAPMLRTLSSYFKDVIVTRAANPRSQEIGTLLGQARGRFQRILPAAKIPGALQLAGRLAARRTLVVLTGSFYLIGEARKILRR